MWQVRGTGIRHTYISDHKYTKLKGGGGSIWKNTNHPSCLQYVVETGTKCTDPNDNEMTAEVGNIQKGQVVEQNPHSSHKQLATKGQTGRCHRGAGRAWTELSAFY